MSTTASMRPALSGPIYKHSGCGAAAKMKFPNDQEGRKQFKHGEQRNSQGCSSRLAGSFAPFALQLHFC
jgi:hypothetical protein